MYLPVSSLQELKFRVDQPGTEISCISINNNVNYQSVLLILKPVPASRLN